MEELLSKLSELDISLEARGDELDIYDPKKGLTADLLSTIKKNKLELLALLNDAPEQSNYSTIPIAPIRDHYKLSFAQRRLYFLYYLDKTSIAYNMPNIVQLLGDVEIDKLQKAFECVFLRHETLRTSFELSSEGPVQKIGSQFNFIIESYEAVPSGISDIIKKFVRPFNLSEGPLFRVGLLKISPGEHLLLMDMHHIIADGISQGIVIRDLMTIYKGKGCSPLKLCYKDYSEWQHSPEQLQQIAKQKDFWLKEFADGPFALDLPTDFLRSPVNKFEGDTLNFYIGEEDTKQLSWIAESEGSTMFMVILTLYNIFLAKISSQENIVIGTPTAGRHHSDLEMIVGMFANILPLRNLPKNDLTFTGFLSQVKRKTLSCLDNEGYPYEALIDDLKITREASRNPLFDVMFEFVNYNQSIIEIDNLIIKPYPCSYGVSKFDLTLSASLNQGKILLSFEYSTNLFKRETIQRFVQYFQKITSAIVYDPDITIGDIAIISDSEQNVLFNVFNNTKRDYQHEETITTLFEKQAQKTPEKNAVIFRDVALTYRELNERSNRLAYDLRYRYNVKPNKLIGIIAERSELMIIGLLGILKSGSAYVPIDPTYPKERIEYILQNSGTSLLLTTSSLPNGLTYDGDILKLDEVANEHSANLESINSSTDLCYVIYTSGSTGKPKGVMISHRNVVNFFEGLNLQLQVSNSDCLLSVTSISFDISVLELFWTLCRGVQIVLHPSDFSLNNLDRYNIKEEDSGMDFSLLFFSSYNSDTKEKYKLLLDSVKFADREGFKAVWTPERHFHEFGGLYPNPSVISSALAMVTNQIEIRSGSVVSPLHDAIRIAEEWLVVDNLSKGRVGLSFASGWNPNDFALNNEATSFGDRHNIMYEQIETVRRLWRGERIKRMNGLKKDVEIKVYPAGIQKELPLWVTSGGNEDTFKSAGAIGANLLTHLLGQDIEELAKKINSYREARAKSGYSGKGKVTIMLHAYVGDNLTEVEKIVQQPFIEYLKSSIGLSKILNEEAGIKQEEISDEKKNIILRNAFYRYYKTSSLIGTKNSCWETVRKLKSIGVDEVACLVDFGLDPTIVMEGLKKLSELKQMFNGRNHSNHRPITMMQSTWLGLWSKGL